MLRKHLPGSGVRQPRLSGIKWIKSGRNVDNFVELLGTQ
jgi:hypothetical protein